MEGFKPTPLDMRLVRFVIHQLVYGPEKNLHVIARQRFLDGVMHPDEKGKDKELDDELFKKCKDATEFMFKLGLTINKTAEELKSQGLNDQDREFMDRLLADVNSKIEEAYGNDLFLQGLH